jgi:hypothetical protein
MPPRKPKQPARKAAPKKAASKKSTKKAASPKLDYNPDTHVRGEDGQLYEKRVVSGTGTAVGVNTPKTNEHLELEAKMAQAIHQAHSEGVSDPKEIQKRILAAREDHLGNDS